MTQGYIRNSSDMKFLLLFILDVFSKPLNSDVLLQAVLSDPCADYFMYAEALSDLCEDKFVAETEDGYVITERGKTNFDALGKVLPYSVRRDAQDAAMQAIASAQRDACIRTGTEKSPGKNHYTTTLSLSDGTDDIVSISLMTVKSEQGVEIERNFSRNAERIYRRILEALLDNYSDEKPS